MQIVLIEPDKKGSNVDVIGLQYSSTVIVNLFESRSEQTSTEAIPLNGSPSDISLNEILNLKNYPNGSKSTPAER